ncbi:hypothetical protein OIO90_000030 [Microbotryomycetes sp. JL221]|nr:hypothetical protein OIO90_000030 [Microbotryomycetes sp. JL221]
MSDRSSDAQTSAPAPSTSYSTTKEHADLTPTDKQRVNKVLSVWNSGKYRDERERAQQRADPRQWQVLKQAIKAQALVHQQHSNGDEQQVAISVPTPLDTTKSLGKRTSRSSLLMSPKWQTNFQHIVDNNNNSSVMFVDEPSSYVRTFASQDDSNFERLARSPMSMSNASKIVTRPVIMPFDADTESSSSDEDDSDGSSDSDDDKHDDDDKTRTNTPYSAALHYLHTYWTPVTRNVIKCTLAYLLAELWTFVPFLTDWLGAPWDIDGPVRNAHVVATIAVYFNPGRTVGSMVEADVLMVIGIAYAMFLCVGSMAMSVVLDRLGFETLQHVLVLIIWLGGGYSLLAYVKVKANKPTVTTVCSMVSLFSSVIITKEGAFHIGKFQSYAILQILLIAVIGSATSNFVCLMLWPTSATSKLQQDLNRTLSSFSTLIDMLTKTFLLEGDITTKPESLKKAIDAHQSSYTTLKTSLDQVKFELFDSRMTSVRNVYEEVCETMLRLSQGLIGMRGGCQLQYELMQHDLSIRDDKEKMTDMNGHGVRMDQEQQHLRNELVVLEAFKERVGPSLMSLTIASRRALGFLKSSFMRTKQGAKTRRALSHPDDFEQSTSLEDLDSMKQDLEQALLLFKREQSQAIRLLYKTLPSTTMYPRSDDHASQDPFADPTQFDSDDDGPNENLFRIFNFCFNFEEWTKQLIILVEEFEDIRTIEEHVEKQSIEIKRKWGPLSGVVRVFNTLSWRNNPTEPRTGLGPKTTMRRRVSTIRQQIARALYLSSDVPNPFPQVVDGALTSHQFGKPNNRTWWRQLKARIWMLGWQLKQPNSKFAIKTGAGAALLAAAAFTRYRPLWLKWRGEWALISYMVIMAQSIGQTNLLSFFRIVGTFAGAVIAVACYSAFPDNAIVLPILGALVSVPCFYIIVTRPQYGPSSRFVLLTYNLTCLYAFNLREDETDVVWIATSRSLAVAFGVVWGLVVTNFIWPFEARRELRHGLSTFFLNSAHLYVSIVKSYSSPPDTLARAMLSQDQQESETTQLLNRHIDDTESRFAAMEVYLQRSIIKLQGLLSATAHEPRLKGPFPVQSYRAILNSCQTILDLLTSIQHSTTRQAWYKSIRKDFIQHCQQERRQLVGTVVLYFSLLASTLNLKTPLPAFLPPASEARIRLVDKLKTLQIVKKRIVRGGSEGLLYLGYALTMMDVINQLDFIGQTFQKLFGIIGRLVCFVIL